MVLLRRTDDKREEFSATKVYERTEAARPTALDFPVSTTETKNAFEVVKNNLPANLAQSPGEDPVTRFQNLLRTSQSLILSGDVDAASRPFADAVDILSNNKGKVLIFSTKEAEFRIASNNFPEFARFFIESKPTKTTPV